MLFAINEFCMSCKFFRYDSFMATRCWYPLSVSASLMTFSLLSELIKATAKPLGAIIVGDILEFMATILNCFFLLFYFLFDRALFELESCFVSMIISRSLLTMLDKLV